jgi:enamine deaminase RidA (YjgF/YER057c/UK114 family)
MSGRERSTEKLLTRTRAPGLHAAVRRCSPSEELWVTAAAGGDDSRPASATERALDAVREFGGLVIAQTLFDSADAADRESVSQDWPLTHLVADSGAEPAATHFHACSGQVVERVMRGGRPVATVYEDGWLRWCQVGGSVPEDPSAPRREQADECFRIIRDVLQDAGMDFEDVVRTWFYVDDILDWYGEFNDVRDSFFERWGIFDGLVPASTGIGLANAAGAALTAEALAVQSTGDKSHVRAVPSPKQCPALDYGSSFSRAVEVVDSGLRMLLISGTASIDAEGHTLWQDAIEGQVEETMEVVWEILRSRDMCWEDTSRATAYVRRPEDMPEVRKLLEPYDLPVAFVPAVVCRDDLLFELELDAVGAAEPR